MPKCNEINAEKEIISTRPAKMRPISTTDKTGMNLFSKDAQWPTFGTDPGISLADGTKIRYRLRYTIG